MKDFLNVALIGHKFMGKAHSHAYKDVSMFFDMKAKPVMKVLCGIGDDLESTAKKYGWESWNDYWREVVADPEIDIIDICTPDNSHKDIAIEAARNGKHVICEKPLALTLDEAIEMYECAEKYKVKNMVNFVYRSVPAVRLAKKLIEDGRIGRIYHFKGIYQQDFSLSEEFPFVWRMDKNAAGAGTIADKGSHIIDLARYLVGEFDEVSCKSETFIKERLEPGTGLKKAVTTNDAAVFISTFKNGALGLFETSNISAGRKNALLLEINGSKGSIKFDLERLNELGVYFDEDDGEVQGFRNIMVTQPSHKYMKQWWPAGHIIGWENIFVHQIYEFISAITEGYMPDPNFLDGVKCQKVVEAIVRADIEKKWVKV